jgi:hypothetical protein
MDGLPALGVAVSVVQFLQFGCSLVAKSRQFYTQGALLKDVEREHASKRLGELTGQLRASLKNLETPGSLSSDVQALETICGNCMNLSAELFARLNELGVDENHKRKRWKSFRQALKKRLLERCCGRNRKEARRLQGRAPHACSGIHQAWHIVMPLNSEEILQIRHC